MAKFYPPMIGLGARILKIQKNGTDIASFSANEQNVANDEPIVANIQVVEPDSTIKTNTNGQFNTITGGLMQSCDINLEPIQSGSGTPSPSNVRPITGHPSVEVDVCGINIFSPLSYETFDLNGQGAYRYGHEYPTGTYTIINKSAQQISYRLPKADLSDRGTTVNIDANGSATVTVDATHVLWVFMFSWDASVAEKICVRKDNDTTFVEFNGTDYTIPLGQTVYGGSLDVVSGVLTVDEKIVVFDGSNDENIGYLINPLRFNIEMPNDSILSGTGADVQTKHFGLSSNEFAEITDEEGRNGSIGFHLRVNNTHNMLLCLGASSTITDVASLRTWLSSNPLQVCYPLATPTTIQLTPQQIETLIGQNNISVPLTGQSLDSLSYREVMAWDDVEKAIEPKADISAIGTDESGRTTASKAYAVGEHFYKDGKFCTAIASISSGATLTLNTNYVEGTIADAVRYEEDSITPSTGITMSYNQVRRFGKVVNVWIAMGTPSNMSSDVILGTIDFIPSTTFGFLNVTRADRPYENVGEVFIRTNGQVVLPSGIPSSTNIYIFGTYICQ